MSGADRPSAPAGFLSQRDCKALFDTIVRLSTGGSTSIYVLSRWSGSAKWARNRMNMASDTHSVMLNITRSVRGASASASTTRIDETGLREAIGRAEENLRLAYETPEQPVIPFVDEPILHPTLWSDATYTFSGDARTDLMQTLIEPAESAGMLSAGTLTMMADGVAAFDTTGIARYYPVTGVECSMTVRDRKGTASGWAGVNHYDFGKIDPKKLAARALDKCVRMQNPSVIEPGRYTVILEPQAVADLWAPVLNAMDREQNENGMGPFAGRTAGTSKINEQVLDRRVTVSVDPMDPDGGFIPFDYSGTPYRGVKWIDQGILRELTYGKGYALSVLGLDKALPGPNAFRIAPAAGVPTSTVEEMIAKTTRGIQVTRFYDVNVVDGGSMMCQGFTRDGLWLIENGKVSRPIKNLRFTDSPLFMLNNLIDIGVPERVFAPERAFIAPAIRTKDFNFASLADAV